eukprot:784861-Rhodomonas_salina.2
MPAADPASTKPITLSDPTLTSALTLQCAWGSRAPRSPPDLARSPPDLSKTWNQETNTTDSAQSGDLEKQAKMN